VAERKVQLEGIAQVYFQNAPILGDDGILLAQVVNLLNQLVDQTKEGIHLSEISQDNITGDILIEIGRELEKWIWKTDSHLKTFTKVG
jgi:DNA-binding ferritin-like protein